MLEARVSATKMEGNAYLKLEDILNCIELLLKSIYWDRIVSN